MIAVAAADSCLIDMFNRSPHGAGHHGWYTPSSELSLLIKGAMGLSLQTAAKPLKNAADQRSLSKALIPHMFTSASSAD